MKKVSLDKSNPFLPSPRITLILTVLIGEPFELDTVASISIDLATVAVHWLILIALRNFLELFSNTLKEIPGT